MKLASAAGVLGEKIKMDSTYNSLVNDQGLHNIINTGFPQKQILGHPVSF